MKNHSITINLIQRSVTIKNNFTSLVTVDVNGEEKHIKVLGEYTNPKSKSNYFGKLAFSPNGDRQHDEIGFKATFLRNYEILNYQFMLKMMLNVKIHYMKMVMFLVKRTSSITKLQIKKLC